MSYPHGLQYSNLQSSPGLLALFSLARIAMFVPRPGLLPQRSIVHCSAFASAIDCLKVYSQKLHDLFDNSISFPVSLFFSFGFTFIFLESMNYNRQRGSNNKC
jgi:hypothetical protein